MAYSITTGAVLEVTFEATQDAQRIMTLFHYRLITSLPLPDGAQAARDALLEIQAPGKLRDQYAACVPDVIIDWHAYAQWITPARYRYEVGPGADWAGTVAVTPYPVNVAAAITKFGEQANRNNIGTMHMPAVPQNFIEDSVLTLQAKLAYDNLALEIPEPIVLPGGAELVPVLFNKLNPVQSVRITGAFPQESSRVMRRRTVGVGA